MLAPKNKEVSPFLKFFGEKWGKVGESIYL